MSLIILGGGCFWCTEAIFKNLRGVISVLPGYAGGNLPSPTYEQVSAGDTGHAEVIQVEFDDSQISLDDLLEVFFSVHDPTTPNRQGHDVGTQYRSVIFTTTDTQVPMVRAKIAALAAAQVYPAPIVTEVKPLDKFYEAEQYHHDYFARNPDKAYCQLVINPKLKKFKEKWRRFIK